MGNNVEVEIGRAEWMVVASFRDSVQLVRLVV